MPPLPQRFDEIAWVGSLKHALPAALPALPTSHDAQVCAQPDSWPTTASLCGCTGTGLPSRPRGPTPPISSGRSPTMPETDVGNPEPDVISLRNERRYATQQHFQRRPLCGSACEYP